MKNDDDPLDGSEALGAAEGAPDAVVETFGQSVTYHRERAGLSQVALARASGLSQATISLIEAGERTPSVANARTIARALGVSLNALVGDPVDGFSPKAARLARAFEGLPSALQSSIQEYVDFVSMRHDKAGKAAANEPPAPSSRVVGRDEADTPDAPRAPGRAARRPRR